MTPPESHAPPVAEPPAGQNEMTGLPWLRTWRGVYVFVLVTFILWLVLLLALTLSYS